MISNNIINATTIWEKYKKNFCEDFNDDKENKDLKEIDDVLNLENMSCSNFGLPQSKLSLHNNDNNIEKEKVSKILSTKFINQLTEDRKHIFDYIINTKNQNLFYIDDSGGSGKTFLYKAFIYYYT